MSTKLSAVEGLAGRYTAKIWVAVDDKRNIQATWYRGCAQPFEKWRQAILHLGWHPKFCSLRHEHHG